MMFFWRLCLLRESPERIPPSINLAIFAVTFYFAAGLLSFAINRSDVSFSTSLGASMITIAVETAGLYALLFYKSYSQRFLPTMVAVFSCSALFLTVLLPIHYFVNHMGDGTLPEVIRILSHFILIWWLAIIGFILHKAAHVSIFQGVVLAFMIELMVALAIRGLLAELA